MARLTRDGKRYVLTCDLHVDDYRWTDVATPAGRERVVGKWDLHNTWRHDGKIELTESED